MKILVVDDSKALLWILKQFLDEHEVHTSLNGKQAIEVYQKVKPDLVLMDIVMPIMDGIEATRKIMNLDPQARIIGITAFALDKSHIMEQEGAIKVINKPTEMKHLLRNIEKYAEQ